jgi:Zn-dependent metalloprotease
MVQSLTEPGEGLAITQTSLSGHAAFAAARGQGVLLQAAATDTAAERASAFIDQCGAAFGLADRSQVRLSKPPRRDALGLEHVKFQQLHEGVPVTGAEFLVHLRGSRVMAANGRVLDQLPAEMTPALTPEAAVEIAREIVARDRAGTAQGARYGAPRLEVFNRAFIEHKGSTPSRLAWFVEATGAALREFIWIDARTGARLLNFSQLNAAVNRAVYDAVNTTNLPGSLVRSEGQPPTADDDVNAAYDLAGVTYDYFLSKHGRDGLDGAGGVMALTVNWYDPFQCPTTFWSGTAGVFCFFMVRDDLVGHELTHGVVQAEANLFSFTQSGALSESFADIFGETIDLQQYVTGDDTPEVRWLIGEDYSPSGFRNLMDPVSLGNPGRMGDALGFWCSGSTIDNGGVHYNSTVPSHAYALMVDGGTYNGSSITGIGLDKAARIQYRALTTYLTPSSGFLEDFSALNQSCSDLVGTAGITLSDCSEVERALRAVEMHATWSCDDFFTPVQPAMCPAGGSPVVAFSDGFEGVTPPWAATSTTATQWGVQSFFAEEGVRAAAGASPNLVSDHRFAMTTSAGPLPAGSRAIFSHTVDFDLANNGGVVEYSVNDGVSWLDAMTLIDGGRPGDNFLPPGNPLASRRAFTYPTSGYTKTRLNLSTLTGQSVRLRFRVGTRTPSVSTPGWMVDNVRIYSCSNPAGAPAITAQPVPQSVLVGAGAAFSVTATGNPTLRFQWLRNGTPVAGATASTLNLTNIQHGDRGYYSVLVSNDVGTSRSDGAMLTVGWSTGPVFTRHPSNVTVTVGQTALFYADTMGSGLYQWEVSANGGGTWSPLIDDGTYSGVTTTTLTITGVTPGLSNNLYRLIADCCGGIGPSRAGQLKVLAANLIANGDFNNGTAGWAYFDNPAGSGESQVSAGVFEWNRPGNSSTQSVIFQNTGAAISGTPLEAQFDLGNSSAIRKRVSVLMLDSNFSDLNVCTFWLEAGAPMRTYRMRTHTTRPWANAAIYFYAATTGNAATTGGYLRLDNVSMSYNPAGSELRTECEDPTSPAPPGGAPSASLVVNGDFSAGMTAWATLFTIASQINNGVLEFVRTAGLPAGVVLQPTGAAVAANEFLTATFDLGNSSPIRKRVTLLIHSNDFTDLAACTFWLPPAMPLSTYQMKMRATKAWNAGASTGATFSLYGATVGLDQWVRLDNVSLQRTPGSAIVGTECLEPPETLPLPSFTAGGVAGGGRTSTPILGVDLGAVQSARLTFESFLSGAAGTALGLADIQVSLDGLTWRTIARVPPAEEWSDVDVDLDEYAGRTVYIRFVYTPLSGEPAIWHLMNVRVIRRP